MLSPLSSVLTSVSITIVWFIRGPVSSSGPRGPVSGSGLHVVIDIVIAGSVLVHEQIGAYERHHPG